MFLAMGEEKSTRDRFFDLVHKEPGESGHWIWLGRKMVDNWGPRLVFDLGINRPGNNKIVIASRYAYEDAHACSLKGQKLKRLCSNKMCVNPAHFTPWLQATGDRKKLLELATTEEERAQRKSAQKRNEARAPALSLNWTRGIAKELVRQRALIVAIIETNQQIIAELMLVRAASSLVAQRTVAPAATGPAVASRTPLVDVFLATVPIAMADASDESMLSDVLDLALSIRVDDSGGTGPSIDLFRSWMERFRVACEHGEHEPTVLAFADAANRYSSSLFGDG